MFFESALTDDLPGKVLPYRSPQAANNWTATIGMIIFLASWLMLFAALFLVYAGLRSRYDVWPPLDVPHLPLGLPSINTAVAFMSSAALVHGLRRLRGGDQKRLFASLLVGTLLGAAFMVLQAVVWVDLHASGLTPQSGGYGSVFYGLTWVHAAHVLVGVGALAFLTVRTRMGAYTPARHLTVQLWSWYWHFVAVMWGIIFVTLYVL